jgi:phosphohistidine swiveling domain-containing protein
MPEYGPVTEPDRSIPIVSVWYNPSTRNATFQTEARHNISVGDEISIDISASSNAYLDGSYTVTQTNPPLQRFTVKIPSDRTGKPTANVTNKTVTGSFTRTKTIVGGIPTLTIPLDRIGRKSNVATVYSADHDFVTGDTVTIDLTSGSLSSFENSGDPVEIINATANYFQYNSTGTDYGVKTISSISVSTTTATVTTSTTHGYAVGQEVTISGVNSTFNGTKIIVAVPTTTKFTFTVASGATGVSGTAESKAYSTQAIAANEGFAYLNYRPLENTYDITAIASTSNTATVTCPNHPFVVGDRVAVFVPGKTYTAFNSNNLPVVVTAKTDNTFSYVSSVSTGTVSPAVSISGFAAFSATAMTVPVAIARSYGEFPENANMGGLEFSDGSYSGTQFANDIIRGSDMTTVAEHLERYTNTKEGFDYRIDCDLVDAADNRKIFTRTFSFVPRVPDSLNAYLESLPGGKLERGTYAPPSAFGADKLVFEYPGNVKNVSMAESAEGSATRVFVVGNNSDLGAGASARYSGSSDTNLLNAGWPILDKVEKVEWPLVGINMINVDNWGNYDSEADMERTAQRFLRESRPPIGDFIITVNGSLAPEVGTFDPGDWCSLVVNDAFVQQRLDSSLEPRKDVIIRRIDGIKVQVPNNPAFPEMIDLDLVTEWQVDTVGE